MSLSGAQNESTGKGGLVLENQDVVSASVPKRPSRWKYWSKIGGGSLLISLAIHAGLLVGAYFLVQTIVTEKAVDFLPGGGSQQSDAAAQQLTQQVQQKKRSIMNKTVPQQKVVSTSTNATIALPDMPMNMVDVPQMSSMMGAGMMSSGGLGLGGLGGGTGLGTSVGAMKGVSFFGLTSPLDRVVFILDFSASMKKNQLDLVVEEMSKTLKLLPMRAQYQVVIFAGGARFADKNWVVENTSQYERTIVNRGKKKYRFYSDTNSYTDFKFDGKDEDLPSERWLDANPTNIKRTMDDLEEKKTWGGTDWRWAFKVGLNMQPAPKVIYFMTDGLGGSNADLILDYNKKHGKATLNTFLMHTSSGAELMRRLSKETGGRFNIVFNDGTPVDGETYFSDRKKYDAMLKIE